jgi:hypothetical protein
MGLPLTCLTVKLAGRKLKVSCLKVLLSPQRVVLKPSSLISQLLQNPVLGIDYSKRIAPVKVHADPPQTEGGFSESMLVLLNTRFSRPVLYLFRAYICCNSHTRQSFNKSPNS